MEQIGLKAQEHGFQVLVAHSSRNENPSQLSHFAITSKFDEIIHAIGSLFLDLHGLLSTRQTRVLIERIKKYKPESWIG